MTTIDPERLAELRASRSALREAERPWRALIERAGTRRALAEAIGVSASALDQWRRGLCDPHPPARARLAELARRHGLEPPVAVETSL